MRKLKLSLWIIIWTHLLLHIGCTKDEPKLFTLLKPAPSEISFSNDLTESDSMNYFLYKYMYQGGGIAIGDLNNDGLQDLYFTGNMVENKLYWPS